MAFENPDERHLEIVRRLKNEEQEADAELLKSAHDNALARVKKFNVRLALDRAESAPDRNAFCFECWVLHGNKSRLIAVPHEDSAHYDRMKCGECGYVVDRKTGL